MQTPQRSIVGAGYLDTCLVRLSEQNEARFRQSQARRVRLCYFHVSETYLHRLPPSSISRRNIGIVLGVGDLDRADYAFVGAKGKRFTYATCHSRFGGEPPF